MSDATARAAVRRELRGDRVTGDGWAPVERGLQLVAAPWQVPELPLSLNPVWHRTASGSACAEPSPAAHEPGWDSPRG